MAATFQSAVVYPVVFLPAAVQF